jgi:protein-tyrosine phosphatase
VRDEISAYYRMIGKNVERISLPIYNSYWVIPGRFRAGEHPAINTIDETRMRLLWLMENGTNFIMDLTQTNSSTIDYYGCIIGAATLYNQQVIYERIPIPDFSIPPDETMVEILDLIDLALSEDNNIYLHCFAGMGRTGMTVGCYQARHGITGVKALEKIEELRRGIPNENRRSPETLEQRRMVKEWNKGQ